MVSENQSPITPWNLASNSSVFTRRVVKVLPPKDEVLALINLSFQGFNIVYPLFDQAVFMHMFETLGTSTSDPAWWACLNVVLALTHRIHDKMTLEKEGDDEAWGYFQNALAVSDQLTAMNSSLMSVQALLGMSLVLMGTPNHGQVSILISSAIKLAHGMGLHSRSQGSSFSDVEIEQRKRVFWVAYCLDKEISLQTGQPPTQDEDNMDIDLPFGNIGAPIRPGESEYVDFFNLQVRLAIIQGQIYKRLCSMKAIKQSVTERVMAAKELEAVLQTWRESIPIDYEQYYHKPTFQVPTFDPNLPPVTLQLGYFNSLTAIYGSLPTLPMYHEIQGIEELAEVQVSAPMTYAAEAREAMKLLQTTPQRKYPCVW
jgi:hypothetical protein